MVGGIGGERGWAIIARVPRAILPWKQLFPVIFHVGRVEERYLEVSRGKLKNYIISIRPGEESNWRRNKMKLRGGKEEGGEMVLTIESSEINVIGQLTFLNIERLMVQFSIYYIVIYCFILWVLFRIMRKFDILGRYLILVSFCYDN